MRFSVAVAVACVSAVGLSTADDVKASIRKSTSIPAQELGTALKAFAQDHGFQIVFVADEVNARRTQGAVGELTAEETLSKLLSGTGMTYRYFGDNAVSIVPEGASESTLPRMPTPGGSASSALESEELEEIIVTAQKRVERLIDTPQSISVVSSDTLSRLGAVQFRDFANTVPGLGFSTQGAGYTQISLRGVTAGFDIGQTVGIYVDDVPYGTSGSFANGAQVTLDVGLFDVDRIEVLRGPQGTLYGASTMGGLIKYVSREPQMNRFGVDVRTGIAGTDDGGISYNGAAALNASLSDSLALRVSGYYSHDGGYTDNVALNDEDVNSSNVYGGRVDLQFQPTEALTFRLGAFAQDIDRDGQATADYTHAGVPERGSLKQARIVAEPFEQQFRLVSGTVTYDLVPATLTSISSYQTMDTKSNTDITRQFAPVLAQNGLLYSAIGIPQQLSTDKFTQEVRLASKGDSRVEWLVGGFYTDERSENHQAFQLRDLNGQPAPNTLYLFKGPSQYEEVAAFANVTYNFSGKFDVSAGMRRARNEQTFSQTASGAFGVTTPERTSSASVSTYLANARYHFTDRVTGYVRYATGYRPGGPNFVSNSPTTGEPVGPPVFESDELKSYEAGIKAETAARRFGVDLAIYHIDWDNIQIVTSQGEFSGIANGSKARVNGAELSLSARPVNELTMTGAFAYQNAELAEPAEALGGRSGERLPNVPKFTAALSADYEISGLALRPRIGASVRHVSDRYASFALSPVFPQYTLPDYSVFDLRAGFELGATDWQLYMRNLSNERGQLSAVTNRGPAQPSILQPRTIGVNVTTRF